MSYVVYFEIDNTAYRLPVNPEKINIKSSQKINTTNVIGLGAIAEIGDIELTEYEFEVEFPSRPHHYIETKGQFYPANLYIDTLTKCRQMKIPVKFIAYSEYRTFNDSVYIERMDIEERAGEEGDYYISFSLKQCKAFGIEEIKRENKENQTYVIQNGDSLISIALQNYGDDSKYKDIMKKNGIKNVNDIKVGQTIRL